MSASSSKRLGGVSPCGETGGAADLKRHVGICSRSLTPIAAVGVSARLTKSSSGCQNQKCVKTPQPMIAGITLWPDLESSWIDMLRPPASSSPVAMIAPNLAIESSCLSLTTFCSNARCAERRESASCCAFCMRTIDVASSAPWRT